MAKGTGLLEDIFSNTNSIEQYKVIKPYAIDTLVNEYHSGKQENRILDQHVKGISDGTNRMEGEQNHTKEYEVFKTEIIKSSQKGRSSKIRTRS